jgi:type VI secretion system protein ImpH
MSLKEFMRFLPTGRTMAQVRELVRLYLVDELEFDIEVWLRGDEVPPAQMGAGAGAMLGWTTWPLTGASPDRAVVFQG